MYGLIVKQPFADKLVDGSKVREYRSTALPRHLINEKVFILNKGNILGTVRFVFDKKSNNGHIWVCSKAEKFASPLKYKHKNGCIIWIKDVEII